MNPVRQTVRFSILFLALVLATVPAHAMMGGGHGGGMGGRGAAGGGYGDHQDRMDRWENDDHGGYGHMGRNTARDRLADDVNRHHGQGYHLGPMTDHGDYYQSDVMDPQGHPVERMWIDKRSGSMSRRALP